MTLSLPFVGESVFVPGFQSWLPQSVTFEEPADSSIGLDPIPQGLLPLKKNYTRPIKTETLDPNLTSELQYSSTFGQVHFISWWKEHIARMHKPPYNDYTVLNTAGNTDGVDAILRSCMDRGEHLLVEEFGGCTRAERSRLLLMCTAYPGTISHCESLGMPSVGVPMDSDGILPSALDNVLSGWDESVRGGARPKFLLLVP